MQNARKKVFLQTKRSYSIHASLICKILFGDLSSFVDDANIVGPQMQYLYKDHRRYRKSFEGTIVRFDMQNYNVVRRNMFEHDGCQCDNPCSQKSKVAVLSRVAIKHFES